LCCVDILLCHDDELDTRRVAFALYLTPSWSKEDGGRLDLFDMDGLYASFVPEGYRVMGISVNTEQSSAIYVCRS